MTRRREDLLMVFDWHGETPWVDGDDSALRQVVVNLLGNAIKFTERGRIALEAWLSPVGEGRCRLKVQVSDTGPGVAPDRRSAIFEPFVQGDDTLARSHGGAGLGLGHRAPSGASDARPADPRVPTVWRLGVHGRGRAADRCRCPRHTGCPSLRRRGAYGWCINDRPVAAGYQRCCGGWAGTRR